MVERIVEVVFTVKVKTDDAKFTEAWMKEFRKFFNPLFDMNDHAEHLAQLRAREIFDMPDEFVEGYGVLSEMGIDAEVIDAAMNVVETIKDEAPAGVSNTGGA